MSKAPLIYYVEDDEHIRDLTAYALHQAGMEVRAFHDGDGLVERCAVEPPDAVLLDIMLPGDDGLVLLQALRGNAATENLPVMMLTAKGTEFDKVVGLDAGADDYLAKPFGMMELISRVNALLRRASRPSQGAAEEVAEPSDLMAVGAIKLSPSARTVVANGSQPHTQGVRPSAHAHGEQGPCAYPRAAARAGVGRKLRRRDAHGGHAREDAAAQAGRGGPRLRRGCCHRARRGLSLEEERLMSATNASRNGCEAETAEVPVAAPEVEADKPARSRSALARNEELARAEKMRREFSANVSHEMKTPLQVISGYAELMANGLVPPEDVPRFAQLIYEESQAMSALIDDVLILSRLDEMAPGDNETEAVNLEEVASRVVGRLTKLAADAGVTVGLKAEPVIIRGNETLLKQMIYNLVENAIRYNRENGRVFVEVYAEDVAGAEDASGRGFVHGRRRC